MSEKSYAEAIAEQYAGKKVEIIFSSDWGVRMYSEFQINNKPVIIGTVIDGNGICLNVKAEIVANNVALQKTLSINAWSILSVCEYTDTSQTLAFTKQVLGKQ